MIDDDDDYIDDDDVGDDNDDDDDDDDDGSEWKGPSRPDFCLVLVRSSGASPRCFLQAVRERGLASGNRTQ